MFRSIARACGSSAIAIVLTGMGSDGAIGAEILRAAGAPVAAQDRASSVVWGMPGAVVARHAADLVAPVAQIAAWVRTLDTTGGLE
jgi:two-component system chemotaxis response regulator CheB